MLTQDFDTLVADDDSGIRELLVDFLRDRGRSVASAADGRAAVSALERSAGGCRLVFTDIAMPGADGFAVLNAARAANPDAYVVMITGYGSLETAINAVRLGAQDYLTKPFSLGQVDIVLRQASTRFGAAAALTRRAQDQEASTREVAVALAAVHDRLAIMERQLRELTSLFTRS
jgi:DNA-binding NtrC family response regulator